MTARTFRKRNRERAIERVIESKGDEFRRKKNMEIQSGDEKMRNASGQQGENEGQWKIKANMNTGNKILRPLWGSCQVVFKLLLHLLFHFTQWSINTVEPRFTATSIIRPFFSARKKGHTFPYEIINAVTRSYGQRPHFEIPNSRTSFNFTPLMRPHSFEIYKIRMPGTCQFYWPRNLSLVLDCF